MFYYQRVSRLHIEAMFTEVVLPEEPKDQPVKLRYNENECYKLV